MCRFVFKRKGVALGRFRSVTWLICENLGKKNCWLNDVNYCSFPLYLVDIGTSGRSSGFGGGNRSAGRAGREFQAGSV